MAGADDDDVVGARHGDGVPQVFFEYTLENSALVKRLPTAPGSGLDLVRAIGPWADTSSFRL